MSDLVQKLVGALEGFMSLDRQCLRDIYGSEFLSSVDAALSEAKAGGWVAVPVEPTLQMQTAALPYVMRQHQARAVWSAMLAVRPLPATPAQRGEA